LVHHNVPSGAWRFVPGEMIARWHKGTYIPMSSRDVAAPNSHGLSSLTTPDHTFR